MLRRESRPDERTDSGFDELHFQPLSPASYEAHQFLQMLVRQDVHRQRQEEAGWRVGRY